VNRDVAALSNKAMTTQAQCWLAEQVVPERPRVARAGFKDYRYRLVDFPRSSPQKRRLQLAKKDRQRW
jgi:hypothetical protein